MAKKQQKGKAQPKSNDSINTNVFIKGMVKDTDSSYFDKQSWYHARNLINNSVDGDLGVVGNEPANLRCAKIPYTIIGGIHLYGDTWAIFSTNDTLSEIGLFDDSKCEYTVLVNDQCLNFNQDNLIIGAAKENFDCTWQVYWDDGLNPSRTLNINNIPWEKIVDPNTPAGSSCVEYIDATPQRLDCEQIRLAPLVDVPCITLNKADQGGFLENGSYQVYVAYVIHDKPVTDYIGISNIQSVWSHEDTQGSLTIKLSNLDKDFEFISVVIRQRVKGQPMNRELGIYSTQTETINVDKISEELPAVLSSVLQRRNPAYEKSDGMWVVNDYLIRAQPTEQFDFNYQPLANEINTFWTSTQYPSNYYKNGGNKPTLLRDEQYAFFIRFIYNTGERSKSYHIPGRAPTINDIALIGAPNSIDPNDTVFKGTNTATTTPGNPFIASMIGTESDDGGLIVDGGEMGFWQSTEVYNPTDSERWANLCGVPIRHHKIPDETIGGLGTGVSTNSGNFINVLGVAFNNIAPPLYNDGTVIPNIVGYEILVGSRAGNRSILAKGIMKNMFRFQRNQNDNTINPLGTGLLPNYPYNDLREDPYLIRRNTGANTLPWYTQINGAFGGTSIESNWHRGNTQQGDGNGFQTLSFDTFTFHSPELNFSKLYLNPSEIRAYKTLSGEVNGRFKKSEDHPQHKLLKNRSATVAALIGVGYALAEMRGKRDYKIDTMQSHSVGEYGVYGMGSGTHMSPMPGIGTGLAAANQGAGSGSIWMGVAADLLFNTGVDLAAIFGGGKLARQIGTPIYQQAEAVGAMLAAGHIGPKRSITYNGTDFSSVPTLMSVAIGIVSFLNYVAVGGDKIIDLILNLIGFQDYAVKYISHGYYNQENQFVGPQWRIGVDKARYIKSALQSFDGIDQVQNNLRPSTVVVRSTGSWATSFPSGDNTKFTIGAGPCAGEGNHSMSWYDPGEEVRSTAVANYVALKTPMDNQYGQLESIIQLNTQGCYNFRDQQGTDENGDLIPIIPATRFVTDTVYAGDCYIARYTEKTIMPFFYGFLKAGKDGIPFDYSKYANVPFPRFWMNTEKYRMDEFVRPITSLSFNWSSSSEALPSGYYNMDCPENGGYCGSGTGSGLGTLFGEGTLAGSTNQDGSTSGSGSQTTGSTGVSAFGGTMWTDATDDWNVANGGAAFNNRFQVFDINSGNGGGGVPYSVKMNGSNTAWEIIGPSDDEITITPAAGVSALVDPIDTTPNFNIKLDDHGYSVPLNVDAAGRPPISNAWNGCVLRRWRDYVREDFDDDTAVPTIWSSLGDLTCRVIFDWSTNQIIGMTNVGTGFYASNSAVITSGGTGDLSDLITNSSNFSFSSDSDSCSIANSGWGCPNASSISSGIFSASGGNITSSLETAVFAGGPGNMDGLIDDLTLATENSGFVDGNTGVNGGSATGGLFVIKTGFMYTHNCGINDFWVESSINLAYRDWEDVDRKRHYDNDEYTDLIELFHAKIVNFDNYYFADRSTAVDKFWGSSWGQIQERWYDPHVAETCYIKYPKRLLYSAPATGWIDKASMGNKNDAKQDFWRVYLAENFRDFKDKVTTIRPINQTGALIMFPTLSPKLFQGQDRLKLSNTKITIGDGGLFSQAFQNITNSDISHEYGSCESSRSVLNTPSGIYFVSQAQGKIFNYKAGSALTAISDQGMKWWFNKFLPSKLLEFFPLIEDCPQAVDNPVNGAGVQTVYDPNNDIIYFCKKDYIPIGNIECLEYIPCEGFVYNATECEGLAKIAICPDGFTYNSITEMCEQTIVEPALETGGEGSEVDIVIAVDSSNSVNGNSNITNMQNFINDFVNGMSAELATGQVRIGLVHFGAGRNTNSPLALGGNPAGSDTMFEPGEQVMLTSNTATLSNWVSTTYDAACLATDSPAGTTVIGGIWCGLNLLYGTNSRACPKKLITILDGPQSTAGGAILPTTLSSPADIYQNMVVSPATPDSAIGINNDKTNSPANQGWDGIPSNIDNWVSNNVINNANYTDLETFAICINPYNLDPNGTNPTAGVTASWRDYTDALAHPGNGYYGSFDTPGSTDAIVDPILVAISPPTVYSCVDPACVLSGTNCICNYAVPPTWEDVTIPIEVTDETYFKDISWTISYDPKAKAWLSFHDWHPELTFNSINHFMTSMTEMTTIPQCPPGFVWNGTECCQSFHHEQLAEVNVEEFLASDTLTDATVNAFANSLDVAIVIDTSGSTGGGVMADQISFAQALVDGLGPGMAIDATTGLPGAQAQNVQVSVGSWNTNGPSGTGSQTEISLSGNGTNVNTAIGGITTVAGAGTTYNVGIARANTLLAGSTADRQVAVFVTDATACTFNANTAFNAGIRAIAVFSSNSAPTCGCTTGDPGCPGYTLPPLAPPCGPNDQWESTIDSIPLLGTATTSTCGVDYFAVDGANYGDVAEDIIATLIECTCTQGVMDQSLTNPPCLSGGPPPQCIECSCPDGYTLVGDCVDSSDLPVCRKMHCDCADPYFNEDETITESGFCDDIYLYYNPLTGIGDPSYVNADPRFCEYDYEDCVPANYEIGYFWKHNYRTDLFNNYYEQNYPWEVDIIEQTGQQVTTLRSIEYQMEAYLYQNEGKDRFHDLDYNFDEAVIYNSEQVSGLLRLILEPKNNIQLSMMYPIVGANDIQTLFSKVEQKYRFNQFWDITFDRGEFTGATNTIWLTDWDGYTRVLNPANLNYAKAPQQRKKFRHYFNHILLRKSDEMATTRKMLLKLENTKLNQSFR